MAEKTPNLNLSLPSQSDPANVEVLNENFRKLDEHAMVHPDMAVNDPNDLRYIENRLAYKEEGTIVFFPTMTVSNVGLAEEWVYVAQYLRYPLVAGNTYTVTVNGESHNIVAQAVRNAVVLDGPDYYAFFSEGADTRVRLRANTSATYGIVGEGEVVNPMGSEYLTFSGRPEIEELTDGDMLPVARKDGTIALIPRNKIGGGGMPEGTAPNQMMVTDGSGVAKWVGREIWDGEKDVLVPEIAFSNVNLGASSNYTYSKDLTVFTPVVGETYTVWWSGKKYTVEATGSQSVIYLNAEPTAEIPFSMRWVLPNSAGVKSFDDPTPTVKIARSGVKKLDLIFLPEGYPYVERGEGTVLEASWTAEEFEASGGELVITSPLGAPIEVGKTYTVTWCGVEYQCEGKPFIPFEGAPAMTVLGNVDLMMGIGDSGEPFAIAGAPEEYQSQGVYAMVLPTGEPTFPLTVKVTGIVEVIHPMDENLLPKMSVGGSGTKIDITVDADGNCTTDASFVDAYNMTAAELQASITIHTETEEWGVFGLAKKPYGTASAMTFYVLPFNDGTLIGLERFTWMGSNDGTINQVYKEAYKWKIAAE